MSAPPQAACPLQSAGRSQRTPDDAQGPAVGAGGHFRDRIVIKLLNYAGPTSRNPFSLVRVAKELPVDVGCRDKASFFSPHLLASLRWLKARGTPSRGGAEPARAVGERTLLDTAPSSALELCGPCETSDGVTHAPKSHPPPLHFADSTRIWEAGFVCVEAPVFPCWGETPAALLPGCPLGL